MGGTSPGYGSLYFGWSFDGVSDSSVSGFAKTEGGRVYTSPGDKTIRVAVNYGSKADSKTRRFTLFGGCERPQVNQAWFVTTQPDGTLVKQNPVTTPDVCKGSDDILGTLDDCCPDGGWACASASGGRVLCVQPTNAAGFCEDYTTADSCGNDTNRVGTSNNYKGNAPDLYSLLNCSSQQTISAGGDIYTVVCGKTSSDSQDGCAWYNNSCWLNVSYQKHTSNGDVVNVAGCLYKSTLGACTGGYQTVSIIGAPAPGSVGLTCDSLNGDYTILCGRTGVKLPFFGMTQFIVAVIILIIIYALMKSKLFTKKKGKKK